MSILATSNLLLWIETLCLLSLARHSTCSPVNTVAPNSFVGVVDTSSMPSTSAPSSVNQSATSAQSTTNLGAPVPNCASLADYPEWYQPSQKFDIGDCPKALDLFFTDYTQDQ